MNKPIQPEYFTRYPNVNQSWERAYVEITDNAEQYAWDIADHADPSETLGRILAIYHSANDGKIDRLDEVARLLDQITDSYARHQADKEADSE